MKYSKGQLRRMDERAEAQGGGALNQILLGVAHSLEEKKEKEERIALAQELGIEILPKISPVSKNFYVVYAIVNVFLVFVLANMIGGRDVGFYIFMFGLLSLCIFAVVYFVIQLRTVDPLPTIDELQQMKIKKLHGAKDWATDNEISKVLSKEVYGIHVGNGYHWYKQGHLLTVGGAGRGKGVSIILPALLSDGITKSGTSVVVLDPKGENAAICAPYYKRMGYDVHVINPFNIKEIESLGNSRFNPLDLITPDEDVQKLADVLSSALHNRQSSGDNSFFDNKCRQYISLYVEYAIHTNQKSLDTIYHWLLASGEEREDLLDRMSIDENFDGQKLAKAIVGRLTGESAKTEESIYGTIEEAISILRNKKLRNSLSASDFDMKQIAHKPTAIFLCIPFQDLTDYAPWVRIFFNFLLRTLTRHYNTKRKVLVLLDEFPQLGFVKEVESSMAVLRGYNVSIWPIVQDLGQLTRIYNESWTTFIGSSVVRFWLGSGADNTTAEYLSKRLPKSLTFFEMAESDTPREIHKEMLASNEIMSFKDILVEVDGLESPARFPKKIYTEMDFAKHNASPNPFYD